MLARTCLRASHGVALSGIKTRFRSFSRQGPEVRPTLLCDPLTHLPFAHVPPTLSPHSSRTSPRSRWRPTSAGRRGGLHLLRTGADLSEAFLAPRILGPRQMSWKRNDLGNVSEDARQNNFHDRRSYTLSLRNGAAGMPTAAHSVKAAMFFLMPFFANFFPCIQHAFAFNSLRELLVQARSVTLVRISFSSSNSKLHRQSTPATAASATTTVG